MPVAVVKGSLKYCTENKFFFLFVIIVFATLEYVTDIINAPTFNVSSVICSILVMGYGLQIIEDVINGGTRLPKIMPKKVIIFGLKGSIIRLFYTGIQFILLSVVAVNLNFPEAFNVEEFFLEYHHTLLLLFTMIWLVS